MQEDQYLLPKTRSGKIMRRVLRARVGAAGGGCDDAGGVSAAGVRGRDGATAARRWPR
jgi:hypothetical protein